MIDTISRCRSIDGTVNDKIQCLLDEKRLEVFDVSADFDTSHKTGIHQIYHAMVVLNDDVFEMNAHALMPNGINMWTGEVWEYNFENRKQQLINDVSLMPEQMKKAIWQRFEGD